MLTIIVAFIAIMAGRAQLRDKLLFDALNYSRLSQHPDEVVEHIERTSRALLHAPHMLWFQACLSPFYVIPKVHKSPHYGWRPVTSSSAVALSPADRVLTAVLRRTLDTLQSHHEREFAATGTRKFWLIQNSLDFIISMPADSIESMFSSDVDSMYPNLDQTFVINAVYAEMCFAAGLGGHDGLLVTLHTTARGNNRDGAAWATTPWAQDDVSRSSFYSLTTLRRILTFVVTHAYLTVGGIVFKQIKGLPQGYRHWYCRALVMSGRLSAPHLCYGWSTGSPPPQDGSEGRPALADRPVGQAAGSTCGTPLVLTVCAHVG